MTNERHTSWRHAGAHAGSAMMWMMKKQTVVAIVPVVADPVVSMLAAKFCGSRLLKCLQRVVLSTSKKRQDAYFAAPYAALRADNHGRYLRDCGDGDQEERHGTKHVVPSSKWHWRKIGIPQVLFPGHVRGSHAVTAMSNIFPRRR